MTFLQQTLGKNYKWWYIFKYYLKYDYMLGNAIFHWVFGNIFYTFSFVFLWSYVVKNNELAIYALVGAIFARLTGSWMSWSIADNIRTGKINKNLLSTTSIFGLHFVTSIARPMAESFLLISVLSISGNIIFGLKFDFQNLVFLIPLVLIGSFINFCINSLLGYLAFWEENMGSLITMFDNIFPILSGGFIPLIALPFYEYTKFNPFAYFVHNPTQIYLGKYDNVQILQTFAGGLTWCIALWILARLVFKAGLKKNEAVGL